MIRYDIRNIKSNNSSNSKYEYGFYCDIEILKKKFFCLKNNKNLKSNEIKSEIEFHVSFFFFKIFILHQKEIDYKNYFTILAKVVISKL